MTKNSVFIGVSLDGYIADSNGGLEWLDSVPNVNQEDTGYEAFISTIDALVMGRTTFETVLGFGIDWPYTKPVYVLSNTLSEVSNDLNNNVFIVNGRLSEVLNKIQQEGHARLYIDGGRTIQSFLREGLIDELIISTIPVLLGGGHSLFGDLTEFQYFDLVESKVQLGQIVTSHYRKKGK